MAESEFGGPASNQKSSSERLSLPVREVVEPIAFEQAYYHNCHGQTSRLEQDGRETQIACYELVIDMKNNERRAEAVTQFMLSAAQAGYKEAMGPLVFPPGEKDGVFGSLFFTLEKPQAKLPLVPPAFSP